MNTKQIVALMVVLLALVGGGAYLFVGKDDDAASRADTNETTSTSQDNALQPAKPASETGAGDSDDDDAQQASPQQPAAAMPAAYVALADYNADPAKYADATKVYYFHADWCPVCQKVDKAIVEDGAAKLPDNVVLIKTDYDDNTDLRKKYGITYQYTFVQVDQDGNKVKQWTATSYDDVAKGIDV
ncbi:hypothetical protein CR970_01245 [Candidatus Saccharibacteria bacterium]|nr:MAG: hypothetical protein CR970_01245 [Candidatus Saccharibacteria bacterium]